MSIKEMRDSVVDQFRGLYERGEILAFATSFGKDSTTTLNLGLEAALACRAQGGVVPPILVLHTDTLVENPVVRTYADAMIAGLEIFAEKHGLDLRVRVSTPSLLSQWPVQVLSGRRLPTFANRAHRACSIDLKRTPAERALAEARRELKKEGGDSTPILILGTRTDESVGRAIRMRERGEGAHVQETLDQEGKAVLKRTFAPIANWSTIDVWEYLALCGEGRPFGSFMHDFAETIDLYRDSGNECVIIQDASGNAPKSACGSRFGCWSCGVAGSTDKSMGAMLTQPQYAFMRGLSDLRNWLVATQGDYSIRRWISRKPHGDTGYTSIFPADYDAKTTRWLLAVLISLDLTEADRARDFKRRVMAGGAEADPGVQGIRASAADPDLIEKRVAMYIERMQTPQFQVISPEVLATIDYTWSVDALHPPHEALKVWDEVAKQGARVFAPGYTPKRPPQKTPAKLWHPPLPNPGVLGAHGALVEAVTEGRGVGLYEVKPVAGETLKADGTPVTRRLLNAERVMTAETDDRFGWDPEGLSLFMELEWESSLQLNADWHRGLVGSRTEAALRYIRFGAVSMGRGRAREQEGMIKRGQQWEVAGLHGDSSPESIQMRCITDAEHEAIKDEGKRQLEAKRGQQDDRATRYAQRAGLSVTDATPIRKSRARMKREIPRLRARLLALESANEEGLVHMEGEPLQDLLRRYRRDWREWTRYALEGPHANALAPLYWRLEAGAHERCATLLDAGKPSSQQFQWGFGMALSFDSAPARAQRHRTLAREARAERERLLTPVFESGQLGLFAA